MKRILTLMLAAMLFVACNDRKQKPASSERVQAGVEMADDATRADDGVTDIHKQWISEADDDGTYLLFDLRDDHRYIEAMTFDEAYCKSVGKGLKPGVFYITNEASDYKVVLERDDEPTQGSVDYLVDEGPQKGQYTSRFQFSGMTSTTIELLFEGEYEHTYKALSKPVDVLPNPEND